MVEMNGLDEELCASRTLVFGYGVEEFGVGCVLSFVMLFFVFFVLMV